MIDWIVYKKIKIASREVPQGQRRWVFFLVFRCNRFVHIYHLRERATGKQSIKNIKKMGTFEEWLIWDHRKTAEWVFMSIDIRY